MKIIDDNNKKISECSCKERPDHKFEMSWYYSGEAKGFLICASHPDDPYPAEEDICENRELQEAINKNHSRKIDLLYEEKQYQLIYVTESGFNQLNGKLALPDEVQAPAKVSVWWLDSEDIVHRQQRDAAVILPVIINCNIKRERKGSFFKKEWFCELSFSSTELRNIPEGAVCYKAGNSIGIPVNISRTSTITLKIDQDVPVSADIFPEYKERYKVTNK